MPAFTPAMHDELQPTNTGRGLAAFGDISIGRSFPQPRVGDVHAPPISASLFLARRYHRDARVKPQRR